MEGCAQLALQKTNTPPWLTLNRPMQPRVGDYSPAVIDCWTGVKDRVLTIQSHVTGVIEWREAFAVCF